MSSFTLITGASAGIGQAAARKLAASGRSLILVARRKDRLEALAAELSSVAVQTFALDVTDTQALTDMFRSLGGTEIDAVINNAGLALGRDPFDAYDVADVERMVDVNISAFLKIAHLSLPFLKATKGHLVNLGSVAGIDPYGGGAVYCGTKAFVHSFSRALRADLLGSGVRVTVIAPGNVQTEFSDVRFKGDEKKVEAVYHGFDPLRAEDIADAVFYALSAPPHVDVELLHIMPTAQAIGGIARR